MSDGLSLKDLGNKEYKEGRLCCIGHVNWVSNHTSRRCCDGYRRNLEALCRQLAQSCRNIQQGPQGRPQKCRPSQVIYSRQSEPDLRPCQRQIIQQNRHCSRFVPCLDKASKQAGVMQQSECGASEAEQDAKGIG